MNNANAIAMAIQVENIAKWIIGKWNGSSSENGNCSFDNGTKAINVFILNVCDATYSPLFIIIECILFCINSLKFYIES